MNTNDAKAGGLADFADSIYSILKAQDKNNLLQVATESISSLGFVSFNIGCERNKVEQFMTQPLLTTWSDDDLGSYIDLGFLEIDPLLKHIMRTNTPLIWEQEQFGRFQPGPYADLLAERKIHGGASIPLPAGKGKFSAITFLSIEKRQMDDHMTAKLAKTLGAAIKSQIMQLGFENFDRPVEKDRFSALSDKQKKILHWVAAGKSNGDIAAILEMPRKQVDYHVQEILRKLSVSSRVQAAIIYSSR